MMRYLIYFCLSTPVLCLATLPCEVWGQITVTDLQTPYSFVSSSSGKEYFISSVNGEPAAADSNGFITKLDANGKILNFKFVEGGADGITLHAPKGMALVERTAEYLDREGRTESRKLKPPVSLAYSTESMRLTTRLLDLASWLLIQRGQPGTVYNLCSGAPTRIGDIVDMVRSRGRVSAEVQVDPARLRPLDEPILIGDNSRLRSDTGWEPQIGIPQIVDELLEYWRGRVAGGDL